MSYYDPLINQGIGYGLSQIPLIGGPLAGAFQGFRGGLTGHGNTGNPIIDRAIEDTSVPFLNSKKGGAISGAAIGASAAMPVAGPFIAAGLGIANSLIGRKKSQEYQKQVEERAKMLANQQSGNLQSMQARNMQQKMLPQQNPMMMAMKGMQGPGIQRPGMGRAMMRPGQVPGQSRVAASTQPPSPFPPYDISPNPPPNAPRPDAGIGGPYGSTPYGPSGGLGPKGSYVKPGYTHKPVSPTDALMNQIIKQRLFYGLDPRILQGQNMAAINSAQDARMNLANSLGRSGDTSGYQTGIGAGIDMSLANQLGRIYPEFLQQNQDYVDQLIGMMRGTRKGSVPPQMGGPSGGNLAGTLSGAGALASGIANLSGAFRSGPSTSSNFAPGGPGIGYGYNP